MKTIHESKEPASPAKLRKKLADAIADIPLIAPKEASKHIRERGYIGQEQAVKAVSLMAYRHVSRLRKIYLQGMDPNELPPKMNMLFVGPTGCGKTFLVEILFRDILELPTVIVDMTGYSETGYVGQDVCSILTRLMYSAQLNPITTHIGIVCLDEFDKLASGQNNAVFAGAGTTKDVTGLGVQRELLKMLESADITFPIELSHSSYAPHVVINTRDIGFIACGAFSGLKGLIDQKMTEHIGFGRKPGDSSTRRIAVSYTEEEVGLTRHFMDYGFLPELIGRFSRIVPFHALDKSELELILTRRVLHQYVREFSQEGLSLVVEPPVIEKIIDETLKKETGARGLEAALSRHLEDAAYEAFSSLAIRQVRLRLSDGRIVFALEKRPGRKKKS